MVIHITAVMGIFGVPAIADSLALTKFTLDTPSGRPQVRMAHLDEDNSPDLLIIEGEFMHLLMSQRNYTPWTTRVPSDAIWMDAVQLRENEPATIISATTTEFLAARPMPDDTRLLYETLFPLDKPIRATISTPSFANMVLATEEGPILVLHRTGAPSFYALDGESVDMLEDDLVMTPRGLEFNTRPWSTSLAGPDSISFQVDAVRHFGAEVPLDLPTYEPYVRPSVRHAMDARFDEPEMWPWVPLRQSEDFSERVFFAYDPPLYENTRIRVRKPDTANRPGLRAPYVLLPERVFPGRLLPTVETLADFNHDGYGDLLTWTSPKPGRSLGRLTQTIQEGTWPVKIMVRLYEPERETFESKASRPIETRLPIAWYWNGPSGLPVQNLRIGDLDGDGNVEVGMSLSTTEYAIWSWQIGFPNKPNIQIETSGAHTLLPLEYERTSGRGAPLVLQSERALTILVPQEQRD